MFKFKSKKIIKYGLGMLLASGFFALPYIIPAQALTTANDSTGCCEVLNKADKTTAGCLDGQTEKKCDDLEKTDPENIAIDWHESKTCGSVTEKNDDPTSKKVCLAEMDPIDLQIPLIGVRHIISFGMYINLIYRWMLGIASILAVIVITMAGFQWVIAAGNPGKITKARSQITNSLIAILMIALSYVILLTVNPKLISLEMPGVVKIRPIALKNVATTKFCDPKMEVPCGDVTSDPSDKLCMGTRCEPSKEKIVGADFKYGAICQVEQKEQRYASGKCIENITISDVNNFTKNITFLGYSMCGYVYKLTGPSENGIGSQCGGKSHCVNVQRDIINNIQIPGELNQFLSTNMPKIPDIYCLDTATASAVHADETDRHSPFSASVAFSRKNLKDECINVIDPTSQNDCSPHNGSIGNKLYVCRFNEDDEECVWKEFLNCHDISGPTMVQVGCSFNNNSVCSDAEKCVEPYFPAAEGFDSVCCVESAQLQATPFGNYQIPGKYFKLYK